MLVSTQELSQHLEDPELDRVRLPPRSFRPVKGRAPVPGGAHSGRAFCKHRHRLSGEKNGSNGRHPLPAPAAFTAFLHAMA